MLVTQDAGGKVWIAYTDFDWIARRYATADRGSDFKMASACCGRPERGFPT